MTELDTNVFDKQKSLLDYQQLQQSFQLAKAKALQDVQTGGIDAATKGQNFQAQIFSAAAATGDPRAIQAAKAHAAQVIPDFDPTQWSDDPAQLKLQADAARQFIINPYQQATLAQGGANIALHALDQGGDQAKAIAAGAPGVPKGLVSTTPPVVTSTPLTQPVDQGSVPIPAKGVPDYTGAVPIDSPQPTINISQTATSKVPIFSPDPTKSNKENELAQKAFELNNSAAIKKADKFAEVTGDTNAKDVEAAKKADELTKRLDMNLQAMEDLNTDVPSSGFLPQSSKVFLSQGLAANGFGDGKGAIASHQFDKINNDQILSDIQQFVATGGANTRINQTLEKIVQAASGVDKTASPEARAAMLKAARAEIANKNATQQNVVGANQAYQPIPTTPPSSKLDTAFNAQKVANIPDAAKQHLLQNPSLSADFDAKYGKGASKIILGQ